jgi:hypothetical protein
VRDDEKPAAAQPAAAPAVNLDEGLPWAPPPAWARGAGGPAAPKAAAAGPAPPDVPDPPAKEEDALGRWAEAQGLSAERSEPRAQLGLESFLGALVQDRKVQLAVLLVVFLAALLWVFQPWGRPGVGLSTLMRHPERYGGQVIRVRGVVGDIVPMGTGHAYYLTQGAQTIVVFTSGPPPAQGHRHEAVGTLQPGVLDGVTRLALWERPAGQ